MKDEKIKSAFKNNFYPILPVLPIQALLTQEKQQPKFVRFYGPIAYPG